MRVFKHDKTSLGELHVDDGVQIGRTDYRVCRVAQGGMGIVLLLERDPEQPQTDSGVHGLRIAIKSVLPERIGQEDIALFRRELTVWAGLRHPNIVWLNEILDGGADGWIAAMDWCLGSLREILNERRYLPPKEATDIIGDVLEGLAYAYMQDQVLHLDLKPENILYTLDIGSLGRGSHDPIHTSRFMVSDWGIASIKQPKLNAIAGMPPSSQTVIRTFNNMGTLFYMAPERFRQGFQSSVASDVFSLGMIYIELLTGILPFRIGIHPVQSLLSGQYYHDARTLISKASVPHKIREVILTMTAPYARNRPSDYIDLHASIKKAYRDSTRLIAKLFN